MKKLIVLINVLAISFAPAAFGKSFKDAFAASGAASKASLTAAHLTSVAAVVSVNASMTKAGEMATLASEALVASAKLGGEIVLKSARFVGDVAELTFRVGIKGSKLARDLAVDVFEFTIEVSRAAMLASGRALEATVEAVVNGAKTVVQMTPVVIGKGAIVVGHSIHIATQVVAAPFVLAGFVLTEAGKKLVILNQ